MIDATIKITVPPEKLKELLQTFRASLEPIRQEQGCLSCNCYVDIEAENTLLFREEWHTREDLETHVRSVIFRALVGAMSLLDSPPEIRLNTIAASDGMEAIREAAARSSPPVEYGGFCPTNHWRLSGKYNQEE
ncbi:MAG: putative quinol monooxygenase [Desulfuromonadales bacterium]|nr:putative quinol monooxygenase [Desulfuromonadales bacterium]